MLQPAPDLRSVEVVLCDLDGVVWLAQKPLPGAAAAIAALRAAGRRVLFVTNNAFSTIAEQEAALGAAGIPAVDDVVNSAQAAAGLVEPGDRVLVGGERGLFEALAARSADTIEPLAWNAAGRPEVAAVVMGLHRTFDYVRLDALSAAVREGARFVATNDDATYPTPHGLVPGGGSLVAAVATAAGTAPTIAGKPFPPMASAVAARIGTGFVPQRTLMVGDQWNTDGAFAVTLGCPFALVRTGVTPPGAHADGGPIAVDAPDLAAVAGLLLG